MYTCKTQIRILNTMHVCVYNLYSKNDEITLLIP